MSIDRMERQSVVRVSVVLAVSVLLIGFVGCAGTTSQPAAPVGVSVKQPEARVFQPTTQSQSGRTASDARVTTAATASTAPDVGKYWALIIGINQYSDKNIASLRTAVKDAEGVRDVLVERYGFDPKKVITLLDQSATRENIEEALIRLGERTKPHDSVLVYYAGHGQYSSNNKLGWWVPVEAKGRKRGTFIANATIRDYVSAMQARHVYLIADSCFSGTLFASRRALGPIEDKYFNRLAAQKSRWGFTSGGTEPVADGGLAGHSIFAYHFVKYLRENEDPFLVPSRIAEQVIPLVTRNSTQLPRSQPLYGAGDEGGQFVFRLASYVAEPAPTPALLVTPLVTRQIQELESSLRDAEERLRTKETSARGEKQRLTGELEAQRKRIEQLTAEVQRAQEDQRQATAIEGALKQAESELAELARVRTEDEMQRAKEQRENLLQIEELHSQIEQAKADKRDGHLLAQELTQARAQLEAVMGQQDKEARMRAVVEAESVAKIHSLERELKQAELDKERALMSGRELTHARFALAQFVEKKTEDEQAQAKAESASVARIQVLEAELQQARMDNRQVIQLEQQLGDARAKLEDVSRVKAQTTQELAHEEAKSRARIRELEARVQQADVEKQRAAEVGQQLARARAQLEAVAREKAEAEQARVREEGTNAAKIQQLEARLRQAEGDNSNVTNLETQLNQAQAEMEVLEADRARAEEARASEGTQHVARVLELENQIEQLEKTHHRALRGYKNKIENLETTIVSLQRATDRLPPVIPIGIGF